MTLNTFQHHLIIPYNYILGKIINLQLKKQRKLNFLFF